ncbi:hypothetical protein LCGC14_1058100 [marine sediment metagenome]|uniref:Uncharacterized protein n=1 Tax=marine sediment metagenome TaxID=412755 RepID=A0A0F9QSW4_9ZZZZ
MDGIGLDRVSEMCSALFVSCTDAASIGLLKLRDLIPTPNELRFGEALCVYDPFLLLPFSVLS